MTETEKITARNLVILRNRFGYTQAQIGEFLGISQPAYRKYETGETPLSMEALEKLANLFSVEEYDLMCGDEATLSPSFVFALRGEVDMNAVSEFHKIVKNYLMMCNELGQKK